MGAGLIHLVEAQAGIDGELVGHLPLVLDVDARQPTRLGNVVGDRGRHIDRIPAVADHAGLDQGRVADKHLLAADREAGTQGVRRIELIGGVALDAGGVVAELFHKEGAASTALARGTNPSAVASRLLVVRAAKF